MEFELQRPHQVLLIDDDAVDRMDICQVIGGIYGIVQAETEGIANSYLNRQSFSCVLLDYRIPGCDSLALVRELSECHKLPVIMLTGEGSEAIAVEAMKAGAKDYLVKGSLSTEQLVRAITNAVEKARYEKELELRQKELEDFAQVASHDLNAPMYKICSAVELLRHELRGQLSEQGELMIEIINSSCGQMTTLIKDLLEYSKTGRTRDSFAPVRLQEVAEQALSNLELVLKVAGAEVEIGELPEIFGDRTSLVQLFQNLISNAVKFRGEFTPQVRVSFESLDGYQKLMFKDNGIGMEAGDTIRIFNAFERAHRHLGYEGSGIGLAICKKVVEQHLGKIWVTSEKGYGATFHVLLPKK